MATLYTVEQLSVIIHKSIASIRSDILRNPDSLPPSIVLPGSRRRLFIDVDAWLETLVNKQSHDINSIEKIIKRGRPTKVDQENCRLILNNSVSLRGDAS